MGFCDVAGALDIYDIVLLDRLRKDIRSLISQLIVSKPDTHKIFPRNEKGDILKKKAKITINGNEHRAGALHYYILPVVVKLLEVSSELGNLTKAKRKELRSDVEQALILAKIHFPAARQGLGSKTKALMQRLVEFVGDRKSFYSFNEKHHDGASKLLAGLNIKHADLEYLKVVNEKAVNHLEIIKRAIAEHRAKVRAQTGSPFFEEQRKKNKDFKILDTVFISADSLNEWEQEKVDLAMKGGGAFFNPDVARVAEPAILLGQVLLRMDDLENRVKDQILRPSYRAQCLDDLNLLREVRDILLIFTTQYDISHRIELLNKSAGRDDIDNPFKKSKFQQEARLLGQTKDSAPKPKAAMSVEQRDTAVATACAYFYTHSKAKLEENRRIITRGTLNLAQRLGQWTSPAKLRQSLYDYATAPFLLRALAEDTLALRRLTYK